MVEGVTPPVNYVDSPLGEGAYRGMKQSTCPLLTLRRYTSNKNFNFFGEKRWKKLKKKIHTKPIRYKY